MSKSDTYEDDILKLLLQAVSITSLASASTAITDIWVALHTADPADSGTQGTNEATYTGYTRIAVTRSTAGFVVTSGVASPVSAITFPQATSTSTSTITHGSFGQTSASTSGKIFYKGAISPTIAIGQSVTPRLTTASSISED